MHYSGYKKPIGNRYCYYRYGYHTRGCYLFIRVGLVVKYSAFCFTIIIIIYVPILGNKSYRSPKSTVPHKIIKTATEVKLPNQRLN